MAVGTKKHLPRVLSRSRQPFLVVLLLLGSGQITLAFGQSPTPEAPAANDGRPVQGQALFKAQATRFVTEFCIKCHGAKKQEGDLRLDTVPHDMADDKTARLWNDIFAQLQFSEMPPSESKQQPTAARKAEFLKQVEAELMRFGRGFGLDKKMLLPQFGNYVDHKLLFDGSVKARSYTPARLWRQRPIIGFGDVAVPDGKNPTGHQQPKRGVTWVGENGTTPL